MVIQTKNSELKFLIDFVPNFEVHIFLQAAIRKELNEFKGTEMAVHDESRHLTR